MNNEEPAARAGSRQGNGTAMYVLTAGVLFEACTGAFTHWWFGTDALAQHALVWHLALGLVLGMLGCFVLLSRRVKVRLAGATRMARILHRHTALAAVVCAATGSWLVIQGEPLARPILRWGHTAVGVLCGLSALGMAVMMLRAGSLTSRARRGALLSVLLGAALAGCWGTARVWPPSRYELPIPDTYWRSRYPFYSARIDMAHGGFVSVKGLSGSRRCARCHEEIYEQWTSSQHRWAAATPWYVAELAYKMKTSDPKGPGGARSCGGCHEPVALLSGNMDDRGLGVDFPENKEEGISCLSCHRITGIKDTLGNGSYSYTAHRPYMFEGSGAPVLAWLGDCLIRGKPQAHRQDLMNPTMQQSRYCAPCHQVFKKTPRGRLLRTRTDFDDWAVSHFNDRDHEARHRRCQDCHMPRVASSDPAAAGGKVHSHRFIGAHTAHAELRGDEEQLRLDEELLRTACRVRVEGPEEASPGTTAELRILVTNVGVGHKFPGGSTDMVQPWLRIVVKDPRGDRVQESGAIDPETLKVDPDATFFRTVFVDNRNRNIHEKRDTWNIDRIPYSNLIAPDETVTVVHPVAIPRTARGYLDVQVYLLFRRSNQFFTDFSFGRPGVQTRITRMAQAHTRIRLKG